MRNEITTSSGAVRFVSRTNDGENALIVNGQTVPSSSWVGDGYYTFEDSGVTFSVKKATDSSGNIMMKIVDDTNFEMAKIPEGAGSIEELAEEVAELQIEMTTKASKDVATQSTNGLMSSTDKTKLDGIASGAEVNIQSDWSQTNTSADDYIKNKPGTATQSTNGLMSSTDKTKLDGIASGAEVNVQSDWNQTTNTADDYIKNKPDMNDYLPKTGGSITGSLSVNQTLSAYAVETNGVETNYIDLDGTRLQSREAADGGTTPSLVTTGEKYTWNNKAGTGTATQSANGLMSSTDKTKLDGIASGAEVNVQSDWNQTTNTADDYIKNKPDMNDYLPKTGGSITGSLSVNQTLSAYAVEANGVETKYIDIDGTRLKSRTAAEGGTTPSLVTTGEKYDWNNKAGTGTATQSANGLMSSGDKTKLDGIDTSKYLPLAGGTMTGTIVTPRDDTKGLEPATDNYGRIGSSSKRYYNAYVTNIYYGANKTKLESKAAASGGTDTSLVTTGDKYTWNNMLPKTGGNITGDLSVSQTLSAYSVSANGVSGLYFEDADEVRMTPQNSINGAQLQLKNLGTSYTDALKSDISSGTFKKAVVGGYLTINGHKYYLAHPDYWLGSGSTECTTHHMVVIPATYMGASEGMNSSLTTAGAYTSSVQRTSSTSALASAKATIIADFGAANILTHKELFANAVSGGKASGWAWADSDVDIPNEVMIFGCNICTTGPQYDTGIDRTQLKLFAERPDLINLRQNWWLRGVTASDSFGFVGSGGQADSRKASYGAYVRPVFAIC